VFTILEALLNLAFVFLFVCLVVYWLPTSRKNHWWDLPENFTADVCLDNKKATVNFRSRLHLCHEETSALQ